MTKLNKENKLVREGLEMSALAGLEVMQSALMIFPGTIHYVMMWLFVNHWFYNLTQNIGIIKS